MPKTPGTHSDDDRSQQPRQTETPTPCERSAIAKEDHTKARRKLADEERVSARRRAASKAASKNRFLKAVFLDGTKQRERQVQYFKKAKGK